MKTTTKRSVLFIESIKGTESLFTRGLRLGALENDWETQAVFLSDSNDKNYSQQDLQSQILRFHPNLICFLMDAPLHFPKIWKNESLNLIPKCSFWFDDFFRSPKTLQSFDIWNQWQKEDNVNVFIWDEYWRKKWSSQCNNEALPIHLAATPSNFDSQAQPIYPSLNKKKAAVFLGTIPSQKSLSQEIETLPLPVQKVVREVARTLETAPWPFMPYELAHNIQSTLPQKLQLAIEQWLMKKRNTAFFNRQLWRLGKRMARLRGLRAVSKVCPLGVLSGHLTENFASKEELQSVLNNPSHLDFFDTSNIPSSQWSSLFRSGHFQLQVTDPQSVEGGLPFRVFESAASSTPLLSDTRSELETAFPPGNGFYYTQTDDLLSEKAAQLFSIDALTLQEKSKFCYQHFLKKHTWKVRWQEIVNCITFEENTCLSELPYHIAPI